MLASELQGTLAGIYLHGSIALDAFDERTSDIDLLLLLDEEIDQKMRSKLERIHRTLRSRSSWWKRSEGIYARSSHLIDDRDARKLHLSMKGGRLRGGHRLGWTERKILHERGVVVAGPHPSTIIPPVSRSLLDEEMWYNLHGYWAGRARRPYLFLHTEMARFAITTIPRILHALEHGEIISKREGVVLLRERFPAWRPLVDEVMSVRAPLGGIGRARRTVGFIHAMIAFAEEAYGSDGKNAVRANARSGNDRGAGLLS